MGLRGWGGREWRRRPAIYCGRWRWIGRGRGGNAALQHLCRQSGSEGGQSGSEGGQTIQSPGPGARFQLSEMKRPPQKAKTRLPSCALSWRRVVGGRGRPVESRGGWGQCWAGGRLGDRTQGRERGSWSLPPSLHRSVGTWPQRATPCLELRPGSPRVAHP